MTRLSLRIFVSFFAAMLVIGTGAILITWWILAERQDDSAAALRDAASRAAAALARGGRPALSGWLREHAAARHDRPLLVIDDHGRELLGRPLPPRYGGTHWATPPLRIDGAPGVVLQPPERLPVLIDADGTHYRLLLQSRRTGGRLPPFVLPDARGPLLLLAVAVTALVSFALARSITRPIRDLQRATQALSGGELGTRVAAATRNRRDELGRLAASFDAMAARLATLIEVREQLLRDVSHELRSPLARMRLATGLARQSGADVPRQLERLETEIERLDELIGRVLDVARLDSGAGAISPERLDLAELVDRLAADARYEAEASGRRVAWRPEMASCRIDADPAWVAAAIENVVRNALRHTPEGTEVAITLRPAPGGGAEIIVEDSGPGVPDAELPRIFEPFHRVATARDRGSGGAGLGLAIAARVMRAHGGSIEAANRRDATTDTPRGLAITLRLPNAPPPAPRPTSF
ncbi:MAG: HAMP domain-containing protein [Gammaproteobacteria bacterium]|nr:HAMP domain-containing protein [Gammaproteobacteria bacterium]